MKIIKEKTIEQECCMCGQKSHMDLSEDEMRIYKRYLGGGLLIQDCFPSLNRCEREFLKSGYCKECQEMLSGDGKSGKIY